MNTYFKIGSNQRERNTAIPDTLLCRHRVDVLYSYDTPVAYYDRVTDTLYITSERHSATTTRHINKYTVRSCFSGTPIQHVEQAQLWNIHHKANLWEAEQAGVQ